MDKLKQMRGEAVAEGCGVGHVNSGADVNSGINSIVFPLCAYKPQEPVTI